MKEGLVLHTDRLSLRPPRVEDAAYFLAIMNTPDWLANIGDRGIHDLDAAVQYLRAKGIAHWEKHGFGPFMMVLKGAILPFGTVSLSVRDFQEEVDIGFSILPDYYRQGYAYEASTAVQAWAHRQGIQPLCGYCLPSNQASIGLLTKLGMKFVKEFRIADDPDLLHLYSE
ncbi:MAG: GNAT family N-acetyltransferase [Bacteroidota bacterium]